jgi:phage recombination protein Bet
MKMENVPVVNQEKREIGEHITKELILSYMDSFGIGSKLNDNEKTQFINVAVAYKLNPFKREIYCNPYNTKDGRKLSIITGYEVYLKRAERIGDLDGWKVSTTGNVKDGNLKAQIIIHRKSWKQPFEHEVELTEYDLKQSVWLSKPITMIKKVVTAQGFRLAFPDELGGMPYTADELPGSMTGIIETSSEPINKSAAPSQPPQRKSAAQPSQTASSEVKTATGFVMDITEPNRGGYVNIVIEGAMRLDDATKPMKFSTKDQTIIDTVLERRESGEKVNIEYKDHENPAFASTIVGLVRQQEERGHAQE